MPKGEWTEQSLRVLSERYLRRNEDGQVIETPEELCWRVAWDIASAEVCWGKTKSEVLTTARRFYNLLVTHEFLPNSPTLMNAGTGNGLQYSACFVLPVEDSLVGIFDAIKYQALIHQTGGGTGFAFSRLRPHGEIVRSSRGIASGPVSFMKIFDAATNEIKQGGKRRGANMGILRVDHPDILEFIHCKEEGGITNFNISVAITDAFMEALKNDSEYDLIAPKKDDKGVSLRVVGKLSARKVWDEIAEGAWKTGDPGLIFLDRINKGSANPVPPLGPVESTNPCGEQPLYPYDSCNLGSIFLQKFVVDNNGEKSIDWEKLKEVARVSTRFLDDVIEMNPYPLKEIRQTSLAIRRIGLGVGGWADLLVELGIPYDSEEALTLGEKIMKVIETESVAATHELAKDRGPFPLWGVSIYKNGKPRRNSTVTTIAPTGSISILAGASSGIEPLFAIAYQHIVKDKSLDRTLTFVNPKFEEVAKRRGFWTDELKRKIGEHGVVREVDGVPDDVKRVFGTAHEINHDWHIRHQAAFQKYTENAVSKTINMRNETNVSDIKEAYLLAWETDCKGVTVFRDGCKAAQVLNLGINDKKKKELPKESTISRPFKVTGATYRLNTPVGTAFVTINQDEKQEPLELFVNVGKAGSDVAAMSEALGRTISTALRFRSDLRPVDRAKEIALQLAGIGGRRSVGFGPNKVLSLPDAIAMALSLHFGFRINGFLKGREGYENVKPDEIDNNHKTEGDGKSYLVTNGNGGINTNGVTNFSLHPGGVAEVQENMSANQLSLADIKGVGDICPSCGASALVYEEGCSKCQACGYSEC
ncbi:ribonucleoside-diphosphate reductase, adenosylcobalamin-dependent [Candidatus Woesebacteria bacterium RIFCSPLOWO2_01_FULL_39_23]|uniref:Vitamin B12-dependent ribonucleotide reductase n=1 Tax=Candidatus Woesebacteria bacterium RIFCSPHIGHO2_01_FULL_40_22 TaxID=1802499 RepID=A0A1F7YI31_9BACT|nr:MAG: ribonucleoside-diphosphate reductase, adenosylcobalamin-dependent [Candidatus Woesebacteria bacterium RBG_16_40_11]OGM26840.1 MAG: ribonucleoside-diphosphate reductase, adenosylcobalamin-dependent [Candidatus Woesebacteria bacterium RIFCSPHIGHO2_01_FULL_40_22]OGM63137.1 MAG: ribonucleoside-diphosphate reductase, adenosylcobalamin-dependent [Candidatus Woesebacteria bacterium RIFCSPLOWO2_01_FULL_39_23]